MMNLLCLSLMMVCVAATVVGALKPTRGKVDYVKCMPARGPRPAFCDCRRVKKCLIKFVVTKDKGADINHELSYNGEKVGPTIVAELNSIVQVDVFNKMDEPTSVHWHGMHQFNTVFMDGVGRITQQSIAAGESMRYVYRAFPFGTHWYHSHVSDQKERGLFGALIVMRKQRIRSFAPPVNHPSKSVIIIRDHVEKVFGVPACEPDGSSPPENREARSFRINGYRLEKVPSSNDTFMPVFYVNPRGWYRFRIIGVMRSTLLRFSIDGHKLRLVATDGYTVRGLAVDYVIIHVGERYDIQVMSFVGRPGDVFPIRLESIEETCTDRKPAAIGFAYLQYTNQISKVRPRLRIWEKQCTKWCACVAFNCPFEKYRQDELQPQWITCKHMTDLKLLTPTPKQDLPIHDDVIEYFFNFDRPSLRDALVNGVHFELPTVPFVNPFKVKPPTECLYENINDTKYNGETQVCYTCSQALYIRNDKKKRSCPRTIRFVLSSIPPNSKDPSVVHNYVTHPIHIHGHSFFVTKIGFPKYHENDTIKAPNGDLEIRKCGPGKWKHGKPPSDIRINGLTARKDVIVLPAGGYVVIEFQEKNPGWWFMHCHIDFHLNIGMGIAINELNECQVPFPDRLPAGAPFNFDFGKEIFELYENLDMCDIKSKTGRLKCSRNFVNGSEVAIY